MAEEHKNGKVQALHPTLLNEQELSQYLDEFSFALSDPQVTNIAISGPYGAGKSTVIDSWEHYELNKAKGTKNNPLPWVHISLAGFAGKNEGIGSVKNSKKHEGANKRDRDVESELINQLIFKLKPGSAPKSRFNVTEDSLITVDIGKTVFITLTIGLTITSVLCLSNNSLPWIQGADTTTLLTAWLICIALIIYESFRSRSVARILKRLKLFNAEVEIFGDKDDPAFNRYMDDIVYLLVSSENNVVVFEDLDRFSDVSVFEKLRRVNELVNARRAELARKKARNIFKGTQEDELKPLRFIYLVRDSLFENPKDRTKFFDLIIPVIPYVDPSNSHDVLFSGLKTVGIRASEEFLYQLSLYVDDPRILKDICNESYHYKKALVVNGKEPKNWDYDKLVAMVSYKVLFPEDYELLQVREGYVFSLFQKQQKLVENKRSELAENINKLEIEISEIESRTELNEEELKLLFSLLNSDMRYEIYYNISNDSRRDFQTIQDLVNAIRNSDSVLNAETKAIAALSQGNNEFTSRLGAISNRGSRSVSAIRREIDAINQDALQMDRESLSDLLESISDIDNFFSLETEKDAEIDYLRPVIESKYFPMIRFFIVQGYIDEDYPLYMSNQHNETLSQEDREFLNSVLGRRPTDPAQNIGSSKSVIIHLKGFQLARSSARNYYLFRELLEHGSSEKLSKFIAGIAHDHDQAFIVGYVLSEQLTEKAYPALMRDYRECLVEVLANTTIDDDVKRSFCKRVMSSERSLKLVDYSAAAISRFVSEDPLFISAVDVVDVPAFEASLEAIEYVAKRIDFENTDPRLLSFVVSKGMLQLRADMVLGCVRSLLPDKVVSFMNLNDILVDENVDETTKALGDYVFVNLDLYLPSLIALQQDKFADHDSTIQMVLNALPKSSGELANNYVVKLKNHIQSLSDINETMYWNVLVENKKCANTTENICQYLYNVGFDDALARLIEFAKVPNDFSVAVVKECGVEPIDLLKGLLNHKEVEIDTLAGFANALDEPFESLKCPNCNSERIAVVIRARLLSVTAKNLKNMRTDYPDLVPLFASYDLGSYVELVLPEDGSVPECSFIDDEVLELFEMVDMEPMLLARLADGLSERISLSEKYPDSVNIELITEEKFNENVSNFSSVYESGGETLRTALVKELVDTPDLAESVELPHALAIRVIRQLAGCRDQALSFLADRVRNAGSHMTRESIAELAAAGKLDDYVSIIRTTKRRASLKVGSADVALIHELKKKGLCGKLEDTASEDGRRILHAKGYSNKLKQ